MTLAYPADSMPTRPKRSILSRVWPFSTKGVAHRTFGTLKPWRNGYYLRGKSQFTPLGEKIWLVIRAEESGPTHNQEKVYHQIEKHYAALLPRVSKALLAEYQKVRRIQTDIPWPQALHADDLLKIIPLNAIWLELGPGHPFVFSFQSELDKDHEFHVFFRHGKLESVAFEH